MRCARVAFFAAVVVLVSVLFAPSARAEVSFSLFYSNLSPHGSWHVSAEYGRVWQPHVYTSGWNPYYDGHWVYSDVGWAWVSDYAWGSYPYHYGTWVFDPYYGWVWVPGYVWAPSWVVFRTGPDYIGWAPVSPGFSIGVSFGYGAPAHSSFVFVPTHSFLAPRIRNCYVPYSRTNVVINNTRIVNNLVVENNVVVNHGPDPRIVERASGRRVREVPIERVSRVMPGSRVSRSQLRVDPDQARQGLRATEPVSASSPLPDTRRGKGEVEKRRGVSAASESATADAPRAGRRLTGDSGRHRGNSAASESSTVDAPRVTRREKDDVERQRGGQVARESASADAPRASRRLTEDVARQRGGHANRGSATVDAPRGTRLEKRGIERQRGGQTTRQSTTLDPRGSRRAPGEMGMKRQEASQRVYREQPGGRNRVQRPAGSDTMRPRRASPSDTGSLRQPARVENPNRRPDTGQQGASGREDPSRAKPSGKGQGKKSNGSGKK